MATAAAVGKVLIKSSTSKMSLNDRFQLIRQQSQRVQAIVPKANVLQRQGSAKNRRLAQQMANRPNVMAALQMNNPNRTRNLSQRLNMNNKRQTNVKQRLGVKGRLANRPQAARGVRKAGNMNNALRGRIGPKVGVKRNVRKAATVVRPKNAIQPKRKINRNNFANGRNINPKPAQKAANFANRNGT